MGFMKLGDLHIKKNVNVLEFGNLKQDKHLILALDFLKTIKMICK